MKTEITSIQFAGYGHKKVTIRYRNGKEYSAVTDCMPTVDDYNREVYSRKDEADQKRATKSLIDFVKQSNNLK